MNATSVLAIVADAQVAPLLEALRAMDAATKRLRARGRFVWNVEQTM